MNSIKTKDAGFAGFISLKASESDTTFVGYMGCLWCFDSPKSFSEWEQDYFNSEFPAHNDATVRMLRLKSMSVG